VIVEGNDTHRKIMVDNVGQWGMIPVPLPSAEDALEMFERTNTQLAVDVIICDNHLSGRSGVDLAQILRDRGIQTPFVLLSSDLVEYDDIEIPLLGEFQRLSKPVISTQLYTAILSSLNPKRRVVDLPAIAAMRDPQKNHRSDVAAYGQVLIVEDNAINKLYAKSILEQQGFQCQIASNGLEAIQAIRRQNFSIALMDCQMPELDGFEATRRIRLLESEGRLEGHLPIIALTANAVKGDTDRCRDAGMDSYLSKPFEPQALREMIEKIARRVEPIQSAVIEEREVAQKSVASNEYSVDEAESGSRFTEANPPIDARALYERCLCDIDFMCSLLSELSTMGPERVAVIVKQFENRDSLETSNAAHALKGAAALLEAEPIRRLTSEIEEIGRQGSLDGVSELVAELQREMDRCLAYIPVVSEFATSLRPSNAI
jgi:Amt family ammonium transporter